jgi:hypothetical protein
MHAVLITDRRRVMATQVNMRIDPTGVTLASYTPCNLFPGRPYRHIAQLKGRTYLEEAAVVTRLGRPPPLVKKPEPVSQPIAALQPASATECAAALQPGQELEDGVHDSIRVAAAEAVAEQMMQGVDTERVQEPASATDDAAAVRLGQQPEDGLREPVRIAAADVAAQRMMQGLRRGARQDPSEAAEAELMLLLRRYERKHRDFGSLSVGKVGAEQMMLGAREQHISVR